jgi:D-glycero-alpha-D-manno-heptose-7-phosphate kinase
MIISKTPFRISFAGGGSDLPAFYQKERGAVLSTTIDKYIYLAIHPFFDQKKIQLKYSKTELVSNVEEIIHPIFKTILSMYGMTGVDVNSIADVPSGTGLGSSSSFTVGLLNVINAYRNKSVSAEVLALKASHIEIDLLKSPIGKQDQYAAAYGGLNLISFFPDETVSIEKIIMDPKKKRELDNNLILIYTGDVRSANTILKQQNLAISEKYKFEAQKRMVQLAVDLKESLEMNDIDNFGRILHEGWLLKKSLLKSISNTIIDDLYEKGIKSGALGGKLLGAGGGGFVLFYCPVEKQENFRMNMNGFTELAFRFENEGSKIIYFGDNNYEL